MAYQIRLNGETRALDVAGDTPLLWAIRETAGLTGTKFGCGIAQCGACTVHADGAPTRSCQMTVADAEGVEITTIEGVSGPIAETLAQVWAEMDVPQCGYCQSGQLMAAVALLAESPTPSDADIDAALWGNLCRCATYQRIRAGVHEAARRLEA
ncbi:MAG: (2Fe-2S)-binding protein [Alphaproteobacteria bacterium]|nr:(2Fe-2S)-binding protein [Alphaproteobacteria bacterium]